MKLDKDFLSINFTFQSAIVISPGELSNCRSAPEREILLLWEIAIEPSENLEEQVAAPPCLLSASFYPGCLPCINVELVILSILIIVYQ